MSETWIEPEERAYPHGGMTRKARAVVRENMHAPIDLPYGTVRAVRAGIADTYSTIPARLRHKGRTVKGFVGQEYDGTLTFTPNAGEGGKCQIVACACAGK